MADITKRLTESTPGRFYVTSDCIDCSICRDLAPAFFTRHEEIGFSIVTRQPTMADEEALAQEALDSCPADAIGKEE